MQYNCKLPEDIILFITTSIALRTLLTLVLNFQVTALLPKCALVRAVTKSTLLELALPYVKGAVKTETVGNPISVSASQDMSRTN